MTAQARHVEVSDTRYGRRKMRRHAQAEANRVGRKVYMQVDTLPNGRLYVVLASDGRGPIHLGMPWQEIYPEVKP